MHVAIHGEDCNSKWNEPLPSLWAIAHGKGTALHVDKLWNNPDYKHLLFEGGCDAEDGRGKLIPKLAGGVLDVLGVIPYELQEALLTGDCFVDISKIENRQVGPVFLLIRACSGPIDTHFLFLFPPFSGVSCCIFDSCFFSKKLHAHHLMAKGGRAGRKRRV